MHSLFRAHAIGDEEDVNCDRDDVANSSSVCSDIEDDAISVQGDVMDSEHEDSGDVTSRVVHADSSSNGLASTGSSGSGSKGRRRRTAFTSEQLLELEREFHQKKYLSLTERSHLAQQLKLSEVSTYLKKISL